MKEISGVGWRVAAAFKVETLHSALSISQLGLKSHPRVDVPVISALRVEPKMYTCSPSLLGGT